MALARERSHLKGPSNAQNHRLSSRRGRRCCCLGGAGLAVASTHSAVSGTENFQMMTTSGTSSTDSVIASGVFTAPGVDHENQSNNTAKFVFSNGTVSLKHSPGRARSH